MGKLKKLIYSATIVSALLLAACGEDKAEENVGNPVEEGGTEETSDDVENEETSNDVENEEASDDVENVENEESSDDVENEESSDDAENEVTFNLDEAIYGPDAKNYLDLSKVDTVSVPQGYKATFRFLVESDLEQAISIYDENYVLVAVKGTHSGRNLFDWETPVNSSAAPVSYKVTGWYKNTKTGDARLLWNQSSKKRFSLADGSIVVGFNVSDDVKDPDYNDIEAIVILVPAP